MDRLSFLAVQAFGVPGPNMGYGGSGGVMPGVGAVGGGAGRGLGVMEDEEDYENEPPLLEELEINFEHIWSKTLAVILPTKRIDITYLVSWPLFFSATVRWVAFCSFSVGFQIRVFFSGSFSEDP